MAAYTRNMKLVWLGMGGRGRGEERCQVSSHYGMNLLAQKSKFAQLSIEDS